MDIIELAKLIRKAMYSRTATKVPTQIYLETKISMLTYQPGQRFTISRYLEVIKSKVECFEQIGWKLGVLNQHINNPLKINNVGLENTVSDQIQTARE